MYILYTHKKMADTFKPQVLPVLLIQDGKSHNAKTIVGTPRSAE